MLGVIICDDKPMVIEGLKKFIPWSKLNAQIIGEATNGREALEISLLRKPDIIITDIRMPQMDGLQLCEQIYKSMPDTVKIVFSAYNDFEYAKKAMMYGVVDYILKPISMERIKNLTERIIEISKQKDKQREYYNKFYFNNATSELLNALKESDINYIINFFENDIYNMQGLNIHTLQEYAFKLCNILFEYMTLCSMDLDKHGIVKSKLWSEILSLNTNNEIIKYVKDVYLDVIETMNDFKKLHMEGIIEKIKSYIKDNYSDPNLCLTLIAGYFNLSQGYISNMFSHICGEKLSVYITSVRIQEACNFLSNSSNSIIEIAVSVGYNDSQYFARVFRKVKGLAPSEYRNISFNPDKGKVN